ncbi:glycoside hydrolase family 127 protein [bacterium]|nr:glycoside hydrolase family 127 protein [bacterium]
MTGSLLKTQLTGRTQSCSSAHGWSKRSLEARKEIATDTNGVSHNSVGCDAGVYTGDRQLTAAGKRLWNDATTRKMYVTGAMGHVWGERFTRPYALDNRTSLGQGCKSTKRP